MEDSLANRGDYGIYSEREHDVEALPLRRCTIAPMPNIASILKSEIARVARKEVRGDTLGLKKTVSAYRAEIAALKRRVQAMEQELHRLRKAIQFNDAAVEASQGNEIACNSACCTFSRIHSARLSLRLSTKLVLQSMSRMRSASCGWPFKPAATA
jgi:hypothetical protein